MIEALIERGHAYESGGDVYFRVRSFEGYGKLSNRDPDEMDQGEEAGTAEPEGGRRWTSRSGRRRKEGEDTAGTRRGGRGARAGTSSARRWPRSSSDADFEIHGGGSDLIFPHHENEVAQSEAARGLPLARIWMHNGMIRIADEKMSKSVGNIFQLSEAVERYGAPGGRRVSDLRSLPPAARVLGRRAGGVAGPARADPQLPARADAVPGDDPFVAERREDVPRRRSATTSTRRARSRRCSS